MVDAGFRPNIKLDNLISIHNLYVYWFSVKIAAQNIDFGQPECCVG